MVGGWSLGVVLGLYPPPTLPDLPQRGMRTAEGAEAEAKVDDAKAEAEAGPGPGTKESPSSGSGSGPGSQSKTPAATEAATQPHGPEKPPPAKAEPAKPVPVRPRTVAPPKADKADKAGKAAANGTSVDGALPVATDADYAAWEADDRRAAAPLARTDDPGPGSSRPPGDRPNAPTGDLGSDVVVRQAQAEPDPTPRFRRPGDPPTRSATFVLGYRSFALADALGRRQSWHFGSLEVTPLRRYFRLNLLTEIGVEGGEAARRGDRADFMLMQKLGLGVQYPHWVTPFIEGQGGIGMTRVELFERNDLALTWSAGVDAGAQWAVTRWMFLHAAVGWVHPVIAMPAGTVHFDRVTFKVGVGF